MPDSKSKPLVAATNILRGALSLAGVVIGVLIVLFGTAMLMGFIVQMVSRLLGTAANALMDQVIPEFSRLATVLLPPISRSLIWLNDVMTIWG
jgi:hypothetical protein